MKLPKTQQELLDAMKAGVTIGFIDARDSYWFRHDNFKRCTSAVHGLLQKGLVERIGNFHYKLRLKP